MKSILSVAMTLILLCSCASPTAAMNESNDTQARTDSILEKDAKTQWFEDQAKEQSRIAHEISQFGMAYALNPSSSTLKRIYEGAIKVHNLAIEISQESELENTRCWGCIPAKTGRIVKDSAAETACLILLGTAKTLATAGGSANKEKAKELYRNIITTYVGFNYTGYVKQAELGLQDLKEAR